MFLFGCCCTEEKHADEVLETEKPFPGYSAKVDVFNEVKEVRSPHEGEEQDDREGHHLELDDGNQAGRYDEDQQWEDEEQWEDENGDAYVPPPEGTGEHAEQWAEGEYPAGYEDQALVVEDAPPLQDDMEEEMPLAAMDEDDFGGTILAVPRSGRSEAVRASPDKTWETSGVLFRYTVLLESCGRIGLNVKHYNKDKLEVIAVKDGLIKDYNDASQGPHVCAGDVIEMVNGLSGSAAEMLQEIAASSKSGSTHQLEISFVRGLPPLFNQGKKARPHY